MSTVNDIMSVARSQIGYVGGENKHNRYTDEYGVHCDWCVIFLWWVFKHAGASALFGSRCALCSKLYNQHTAQAVGYDDLRMGDIVFFDWSGAGTAFNHVGIVESRNGNELHTIEGNTGNAVRRRIRKRKYISHAFRPKYSEEEPITDMITLELPVLKNGSKGFEVKTLQRLLMSNGYSMRPYGADGDFGSLTEQRLREYQRKQKLPENGTADGQTWNKLLKG